MAFLSFCLGLFLLFVVDGNYYPYKSSWSRSSGYRGGKFFARMNVHELTQPDPVPSRSNTRARYTSQAQQNEQRRINSVQSYQKAQQNEKRISSTRSYQKGPQTRSQSNDYSRQLGRQGRNLFQHRTRWIKPIYITDYARCVRNLKVEDGICQRKSKSYCRLRMFRWQCPRKCQVCGPPNGDTGSIDDEYQREVASNLARENEGRRTRPTRNRQKGPRRDDTRLRSTEYQQQPRTNINTSRTGRGRGRLVSSNEKGPRTSESRSRNTEYQREIANSNINVGENEAKRRPAQLKDAILCKREDDKICARKYATECSNLFVEMLCPTLCGTCEPRPSESPSRSSEYQRPARTKVNAQQNYDRRTPSVWRNTKEQKHNSKSSGRQQDQKALLAIRSFLKYEGCKDKRNNCRYLKSIGCCKLHLGKILCALTCGVCVPFAPVCPSSYRFGCCWDGTEAKDPEKTNCSKCENTSDNICDKAWVKNDCDFQERSSLMTRYLCPETCGACNDYS